MITLPNRLKLDIKHVVSNLVNRNINTQFKQPILNNVRLYDYNGTLNVSIANSETTCKLTTNLECPNGLDILVDSRIFKNSNHVIEINDKGELFSEGVIVSVSDDLDRDAHLLFLDYITNLDKTCIKIENRDLRFLNRCTSTDSLRPNLEGVYLDTELNRVVSTDGHLLHYVEHELKGLRDSLILCNTITKSISKVHNIKEEIEFNVSSNGKFVQVGLDRPYGSMIFKNNFCKDKYPKYDQVIPLYPDNSIVFKDSIIVKTIKDEKGFMLILSGKGLASKDPSTDITTILDTSNVIERSEETSIAFNRSLLTDVLSYMFTKVGKVEMKYIYTLSACIMKTSNSCTLIMPMKIW